MEIFKRRPFMLCCAIFIFVYALLFFFRKEIKLGVMIACASALAVILFLFAVKKIPKKSSVTFGVCCLAIFFTLIASVESYLCFDVYLDAKRDYQGEESYIELTVTSIQSSSQFESSYYAKLGSINGNGAKGKAYVSIDASSDFKVGDKIRLVAESIPLQDACQTDNDFYFLLSDGIRYAFTVSEDQLAKASVIDQGHFPLKIFISSVRKTLCRELENNIGGNAGKLSSALLLGESVSLSSEIKRDFSRSGIFHMLALSGLHLAIVTGFIDFILRKARIPKLARTCIMPLIIFIYLAITSFNPSTVRAAIMLCAVYLTFIVSMPSDSLTVLFFTGFAILLFSPTSIVDLGFLMSFTATFGVVIVSVYLNEKRSEKIRHKRDDHGSGFIKASKRIFEKVATALLITVSANTAILFLNYLSFKELSLVFPLTNLLFSPLVTLQLVFSFLTLTFAKIPFLNIIPSFAAELTGNALIRGVSFFSDIRNVTVSLSYGFSPYVIFSMTLATALLLVIRLKRKYLVLLPTFIATAVFAICLGITLHNGKAASDMIYLKSKDNDFLIIASNQDTVICDFSNGTYSNINNAYTAAKENCATEIGTFIMTHYHNKHTVSVSRLLSNAKVRRIALPYPENEESYAIFISVVSIAELHGTEVYVYNYGDPLTFFGHGTLSISEPSYLERSVQPSFCAEYSFGDGSALYVGSSYPEANKNTYREKLANKNFIIYGTHGPLPKIPFDFPDEDRISSVIFSEEEIFKLSYIKDSQSLPCGEIRFDCEYKKLEFKRQK